MHRYADEVRSEDEAAEAARAPSKKETKAIPAAAAEGQMKLEIAVEDVPAVQLSGLDPEHLAPPSPSPSTTPTDAQTPDSFGRSLGLDEEELKRGLMDDDDDESSDDDDSGGEVGGEMPQAQPEEQASGTTALAEEGVPPACTADGVSPGVDDEGWDDV